MRTQRDFIIATLKQTLKPSNIFKIGQILEIAHKNVDTNIKLSLAKDYIPYAVELDSENITSATLPGSTPDISKTNSVSIFVADKTETKKLIQSMFYADAQENSDETNTINNTVSNKTSNSTTTEQEEQTSTDIKIELQNASGDSSKLVEAKKLLEEAGYTVKQTGKSKKTLAKTIITNKKDVTSENLKNIKQVLGKGDITTNKVAGSTVDVTIVIGKDF